MTWGGVSYAVDCRWGVVHVQETCDLWYTECSWRVNEATKWWTIVQVRCHLVLCAWSDNDVYSVRAARQITVKMRVCSIHRCEGDIRVAWRTIGNDIVCAIVPYVFVVWLLLRFFFFFNCYSSFAYSSSSQFRNRDQNCPKTAQISTLISQHSHITPQHFYFNKKHKKWKC